MKFIALSLALIFIFYISTFAQKSFVCPEISVQKSNDISASDNLITFTASINEIKKGFKPEYLWMVNDGEIVEGKETLSIKVKPKNSPGIISMIEIKNLPE